MKRTPLFMPLSGLWALAVALPASAHEGHGLPGASHWHGTDAWGFLAVAALVAVVLWMKGRK